MEKFLDNLRLARIELNEIFINYKPMKIIIEY